MRPVRHIPRYTYSDYLLWEGQWEMIDGIPLALKPSNTLRHQRLSSILLTQIIIGIRNSRIPDTDIQVISGVDWIVDDNTVLRPDIAVVCHETGDFITTPPSLIVEILSPSTAHKDRMIKYEIYEEQGVKHYIIADPSSGVYTVYQLIEGKYQEHSFNVFTIHEGCTITIDITQAIADLGE